MKNLLKNSNLAKYLAIGVFGLMCFFSGSFELQINPNNLSTSSISFEIGQKAFAQSSILNGEEEEGTGTCSSTLPCSNGGTAECSGTKTCRVYSWYVECDGVTSYC